LSAPPARTQPAIEETSGFRQYDRRHTMNNTLRALLFPTLIIVIGFSSTAIAHRGQTEKSVLQTSESELPKAKQTVLGLYVTA